MSKSTRAAYARLAVFVTVALIAGGCSAYSTSTPYTPVTSAQETIPLAPAGTAMQILAVGGFSGQFKEAANNAPAGTTITLTSYDVAPAGAPGPYTHSAVRPRAFVVLTNPTVLFWVSHTYNNPVVFQAFPITSWVLAPGTNTSGVSFWLETFDGSVLLAQEAASSVVGSTVNFPGVMATFTATPGHTYWWEVISASNVAPTPTPTATATPPPTPTPTPPPTPTPTPPPTPTPTPPPTPTPTPSPTPTPCTGSETVTVTVSNAGGTLIISPLCGISGSISYPANNAPAGTTTTDTAIVPNPVNAPPIPAGATHLISLEELLSNNVTFNAGSLALSLTLPIMTAGHTFNIIACDIASCATPFTATIPATGPNTIGFSGIPLPFVATAGHTYIGEIYYTTP